jgi:hypothetical protein
MEAETDGRDLYSGTVTVRMQTSQRMRAGASLTFGFRNMSS